jgi:hypothetical protein
MLRQTRRVGKAGRRSFARRPGSGLMPASLRAPSREISQPLRAATGARAESGS